MATRSFALLALLALSACQTTALAPASTPPMLIADVRISIRPDAQQTFDDVIGPFLEQSRRSEGNLDFQLLRVEGEPHRFVLLERWESRAAFEAYLGSDAFAAFRIQVGPLLAGPPESAYYDASPAERETVR